MGIGIALGGYTVPGGYMAKGDAVAAVVLISTGFSEEVSFFVDAKVALVVSSVFKSLVASSASVSFKLEDSLVDLMLFVWLTEPSVCMLSLDVSFERFSAEVTLQESESYESSDSEEVGLQDE